MRSVLIVENASEYRELPLGLFKQAGFETRSTDDGEAALGRRVRLDGSEPELTRIEYELLDALSENPRLSISRQQLLDRVWGPTWFGDDHVVDVHVSNLRRKLGDDPKAPRFMRTVRGFGYRLEAPADDRPRAHPTGR